MSSLNPSQPLSGSLPAPFTPILFPAPSKSTLELTDRQAESKTKDICPIYKGKCILTPTDLQEDEALHQKAVS